LANVFKNLYVFEILIKLQDYDFLVFNSPEFPFLGKFATYSPRLCYDLIKTLAGQQKKDHINLKRLSVMASHEPAGTSVKNLIHWYINIQIRINIYIHIQLYIYYIYIYRFIYI
jgi:hypothetical protein